MIHKQLLTLLMLWLCTTALMAQTTKSICVSKDQPYTDHMALKSDARDMDLMVKVVFNEDDNQLTVSLISYRTLFVFWDNILYKSAIKRRWIKPERLTYVASNETNDCFRLTKACRNSLSKPFKKHVFKRWIEYDGLQPKPQELKMANDFIEQTFDIPDRRSNVTFRLRDLMLMELTKRKDNRSLYHITFVKDLDTEYLVTIERDPCFGLDEEISAAEKSLESIRKTYDTFKKKYNKRVIFNPAAAQTFRELKQTLTTQFPKDTTVSACPVIQDLHNQYNAIVDSLSRINIIFDSGNGDGVGQGVSPGIQNLNVKNVMNCARQIDSNISRWLVSRDESERSDLRRQCISIIKDASEIINHSRVTTEEERRAVRFFRQAVQYFNKTCK